jgi:hypothetical protein
VLLVTLSFLAIKSLLNGVLQLIKEKKRDTFAEMNRQMQIVNQPEDSFLAQRLSLVHAES